MRARRPACAHQLRKSGLSELLADEQLRSVLGKRAQEYAAEYTWERTTTDLYSFLRQLAQQATPR